MQVKPSGTLDEYLAPVTIEEAARALADGRASVLAGGTDLMLQAANGRTPYRGRLVNIRRIAELRGAAITGGRVRIGALTTVTDILNHAELAKAVPVLRQTADKFASNQIRNMATIGGNICNASPAGDMIIPLLALEAEVELASWDGAKIRTREVALEKFFTGPGRTVMERGELLTAVSFAVPEAGHRVRFAKSGPRPALEISTVSAAFAATCKDGVTTNVRIVLGAVAPTPIRARSAEALMEGAECSGDLAARAAKAAAGEISPIDDVRASAWYRTHLTEVFVRRLIEDVCHG
ncbi:MAG: xanthine dehydrogenase family protein subunit M [Rhodobiaceae bacterium]|nr:xanthine dehydrogenase family protein subunit M [Rhodobiaceae bacterium]